MACGLSTTGVQLIIFRAFSGIAASFSLPSAVGIIHDAFPPGHWKNIAFASMGGGQPVGYGLGLALGGFFADTIGWPWGFHFVAIINLVAFVLAACCLPNGPEDQAPLTWRRFVYDIDWVGAFIASTSLAIFFYVLTYYEYPVTEGNHLLKRYLGILPPLLP